MQPEKTAIKENKIRMEEDLQVFQKERKRLLQKITDLGEQKRRICFMALKSQIICIY